MTLLAGLIPAAALLAQGAGAGPSFETAPTVPGSWSYRSVPGLSEASFLDTSGGLRLSIRCARTTRQVSISRPSATPANVMFVWTSSAQRSLAAAHEPNAVRVTATLSGADRFLDSIAFSRGRIAVSIPGALPLIVHPGPEAARVFEDCRI